MLHTAVLAAALVAGGVIDDVPRLVEGAAFPVLPLPALDDGRPTTIADFRGRKVVLHVFASW